MANSTFNGHLEINETIDHTYEFKNTLPPTLLSKIQKDLWYLTPQNKSEVIIQLKNDVKLKLQQKITKGKSKFSYDNKLLFAELYGDEISAIAEDEDVLKIWPDLKIQSFLNKSVYQIKADYLWNLSLNGSRVKVAVLDTGIDSNHEMLNGRVILQQDFTK